MADEQFEQRALDVLGTAESKQYTAQLDRFVEYMEAVTEAIPVLKAIAAMDNGFANERVRDFREQGWECLMATGLVVIGRIGYLLLKYEVGDWEAYVAKLAQSWAAHRITDYFRLKDDCWYDFDDAAECDGVNLEMVDRGEMLDLLSGWATAQLNMLSAFDKPLGDAYQEERAALRNCAVQPL